MNQEPTKQDILEAIHGFSSSMDTRLNTIESDIKIMKSTMVTKDYLDEKLSDLRGDLTILIRKEDTKLKTLVDILTDRGVLTAPDKQQILSMEPFAQVSL